MAELSVTEYDETGAEPALARTSVTYTTSTRHVLKTATKFVLLTALATDAFVEFTADTASAVATAESTNVPADTPMMFRLKRPGGELAVHDGTS